MLLDFALYYRTTKIHRSSLSLKPLVDHGQPSERVCLGRGGPDIVVVVDLLRGLVYDLKFGQGCKIVRVRYRR